MPTDSAIAPRVFTREDMNSGEACLSPTGRLVAWSARQPGKPGENEDAAAVIPVDDERSIIAIADGLGGHAAGAVAAELALRSLVVCAETQAEPASGMRAAVLDGFELANRQVTDLGIGAATTLAVVEIDGRQIRPYHAGDSMILVVGQRGKVKLQTLSHSPVGYAVEAGLLDESEAIHHEDRHVVSNIVGSPEMRIDVGPPVTLSPRDTLLLASDGLFDNLHVPEICQIVRKGPLEAAAERLFAEARRRMTVAEPGHPNKPDDLTFVLYRPV